MRDPMTPMERVSLLLIDEEPDQLVRVPLVTAHAAAVAGLHPGDCVLDGQLMAEAQLVALDRYGHDAFTVFSDVGILAEAMGSIYRHDREAVPILETPVAVDEAAIARLRPPEPDEGRLPVYVEAVRALHRARGDRVPVTCFVPAPFTTAAGLRGVEDFLVDTLVDPDLARRLVEIAEAAAIPILDEIVLAGGLPVLVDPLASASVASPKAYREFALPGTRRLIERLHRLDLDITLHVCGEIGPILGDLADTGADLLSFDRTPVREVREQVGDRMRLFGNLAPSLLLAGTADEVRREALDAVRDGAGNPKGFVLSTGCELAVKTPPENVDALMEAGLTAGSAS